MAILRKKRSEIKTPGLAQILIEAMSHAAEISITTCVVDDLDDLTSPSKQFSTEINLVDCTVNHEIDLKLIDNPAYRELQRWHIEQVKHKQTSIVRNLASLESMRRIVED